MQRAAIRAEVEASARPRETVPRPNGPSRRLFEPEYAIEYFPETDTLYLAEPGAVARCEPADGSIRIAVDAADTRARFIASHLFFTISLLEILKRHGRFAIHAAGVAVGGRAALISGAAGSGKSTLAFASLQAGLAFLGDDVTLLRDLGGTLRARAFPDSIELARDSTRFFPDLADVFARPTLANAPPKRPFHPIDRGPVQLCWDAEPAFLVFPNIVPSVEARVVEMSADDAFLRLVPNVVRTEHRASQAHLDILATLARTLPAYELKFSSPLAVPALLRARLSQGLLPHP
jgi:hypothetical protein